MKHFVYRFSQNEEIIGVQSTPEKILYIGETQDFENRMEQHFSINGSNVDKECYTITNRVEFLEFDNSVDAKLFEIYYINVIKPYYNKRDKTSDIPTPNPLFDSMADKWRLWEVGNIKETVQQNKQNKKERVVLLVKEFDTCNKKLLELTKELELTSVKMRKILNELGEDFLLSHIYNSPYGKTQYITNEGAELVKEKIQGE